MHPSTPKQNLNEEFIKILAPKQLKQDLQAVAVSRNISLSALVRLIVSDYLKARK